MSAAKKQRAAIYARVSDDDGKTESIPTQVRQCRDYAKSKGMTVVTIFDKDSGISGGIPPHLRPDGARLYAARKRGEFDAVIVTEPTRFYRSDELASVLRDWEAAGIAVVFVGKEIDMEGDDWELTAGVHGIMGQQFRRMIARKDPCRAGLACAAAFLGRRQALRLRQRRRQESARPQDTHHQQRAGQDGAAHL